MMDALTKLQDIPRSKRTKLQDAICRGSLSHSELNEAAAELAALEAVAEAGREVEQWLGGGSTKSIVDLQVDLLAAINKLDALKEAGR